MKYPLPFLLVALSLCAAAGPSEEQSKTALPLLRTEHKVKRDENGVTNAYIDTVYRGNGRSSQERILQTVTFKKKNQQAWGMWRTYYLDGEAVMSEADDDGDGRPETITLFKNSMVGEMFRRQPDGSVDALSSEELAKFQDEQRAMTGAFGGLLDVVHQRIETNSVAQVMQDLKTELEEYKQKRAKEASLELPPRQAGLEFKTQITANLQASKEAETLAGLERMLHYMEDMKLKDQADFFSAWPDGMDGARAWIADVKSKLEKLEHEKN